MAYKLVVLRNSTFASGKDVPNWEKGKPFFNLSWFAGFETMVVNGWIGEILHVNLSNSEITQFSRQRHTELYLGGRGIPSRVCCETVIPKIKAFDPESRFIFMTGPLVATGTQGASRLSVAGKSPMIFPEGCCYGNIGAFVGPESKKAGFDGVVVEGRAPRPAYLKCQSM